MKNTTYTRDGVTYRPYSFFYDVITDKWDVTVICSHRAFAAKTEQVQLYNLGNITIKEAWDAAIAKLVR